MNIIISNFLLLMNCIFLLSKPGNIKRLKQLFMEDSKKIRLCHIPGFAHSRSEKAVVQKSN
jgi:hypothetical protein